MLEKIFSSKARVKILKTFLLNPDKKYYIRQLSRELKLQVNSVRRELNNLEDFGLLVSVDNNSTKIDTLSNELEKKNLQEKKYYWADKSFVLFSELKHLIIKSQILASESLVSKLKDICDPQFVLLSGIFVANDNSSTDILIVADLDKSKLVEIISDLELEMGREINFTLMDEAEFKYRQEIADVFLHSALNSRKIILIDKILNN